MSEATQKIIHTFAALADLGEEIADTHDFGEMVRTSLHLLMGTLAIRRGAIAEYDSGRRAFTFVAARVATDGLPGEITVDEIDQENLVVAGLTSYLLDDAPSAFHAVANRNRESFSSMRIELAVPLIVRAKMVGMVLLGEKADGEPLTTEDREIICSMSRHIGVGLHTHRMMGELERKAEENRLLYHGLRAIYKDTVRAFAAAIDIKDKYTQGHSERVGKYSEIIAREMGWGEEEVEGIAIAGYLHDIGKLVVERDIINAPYRIDAAQSSELNKHPAAGYEILAPINHPWADIPLMARHHHERVDGRGYPDGLSGDDIPLGAKIVTLADSFDAMTTDRPYRRRQSLENVVADFRKNVGKQFAPEVVASFCRAILKEVKGEVKERRITKMLGKGYVVPQEIEPLLIELIEELDGAVQKSVGAIH
jgi:HD-GYP domain-containing protein (c-di-GMP phosphodiesterase class II)